MPGILWVQVEFMQLPCSFHPASIFCKPAYPVPLGKQLSFQAVIWDQNNLLHHKRRCKGKHLFFTNQLFSQWEYLFTPSGTFMILNTLPYHTLIFFGLWTHQTSPIYDTPNYSSKSLLYPFQCLHVLMYNILKWTQSSFMTKPIL